MDVQQDLRISQLIPSIKCSDCGETVEFRRLGDHNCKGAPAVPIIPNNYQNSSIKSPSPTRPVNNVPVSSPFSSTPRPNLNPLSVPAGYGYDNGRSRSPHDNASSPTDSGYSGYSGSSKYSPATPVTPATPTPKSFLQKYEQVTGKQINSPQTPRNVPLAENNYNANGNVNGFGDKYTTPYDNKFTQPNKPRDPYGQAYPVDRGISDPRRPPNNDRPYDYGYNQPPLFNDNIDFLDDPYRAARPKVPTDPRPDFMRNQNPNDRYNNSNNDYMRNRSPTSNDGNKYRPSPSSTNQPYGQSPYDYAGSRMPPRPPQEKNGVPGIPPQSQPQQPYSKPYTPINPVYNNNNNKDNLESRRYDQGDRKDTSNPYAVNGVGLDDMMDDLLREMNNMQTSSQSEKENSNTRDICAYCKTEITSSSTALWAVGKAWHSNHLLCAHCRKPIDPNVGHVEKDDKVYCPKDFADLFLPKCRRCNLPVEREAVSASDGKLQGKWHVKCFVCHTCYKPFPNKSFYVFDNAPYCKLHYHKLNNSLCKNCNDPIEGPCAQTVEGWRYHPNCFVCFVSGCQTPLTDIYYSFETRQYCETHIMEIQRRRKIQPEKRRTIFHNI